MPAGGLEDAVVRNDHADYSNSHGLILPTYADAWVPLLLAAWDNDIVTVVGCSNERVPLGEENPTRFGRADNPLITVCRLRANGKKSRDVSFVGPSRIGSDADNPKFVGNIDIWAIGEGLSCPVSNSLLIGPNQIRRPQNSWDYDQVGSSFSTPQISALCSYLAGSPQFATIPPGSVAMKRKTQLVSLSRSDPNFDTLGAAYNGVRQAYCDLDGTVQPRAHE